MNMALAQLNGASQADAEFCGDVLRGLQLQQKTLPCKYLYDEAGSRLFERICELGDYYLTRTETAIFQENLPDIARHIGPNAVLIEPGAGNCEKVRPLLEELQSLRAYIPIDISPEILLAAKADIQARLPQLKVEAAVGDFTQPAVWTNLGDFSSHKRAIFFPGSTIGNFDPQQARALLLSFAAQLSRGDGLLIGTDLVKDSVVLERAYNDSEHVTAEFNKNLLRRINSELRADFDLSLFAHRAFYHPLRQRVEMHLVSLKAQQVTVAGESIAFREGETIHTENSHKYTQSGFAELLRKTGYTPVKLWSDSKQQYAIHYAELR